MDRETRIAWLVDHSQHPRHRGALPDADVRMQGGNPGCGDVVTLYLRTSADGSRIDALAFEGEGCTLSQAAASILAERVNREHPTLEAVAAESDEVMTEQIGRDLVSSRPRCATLALGTLKAAIRRLDMDRRLRRAGRTEAEIRTLRGEDAPPPASDVASSGLVFGEGASAAAGRPGSGRA